MTKILAAPSVLMPDIRTRPILRAGAVSIALLFGGLGGIAAVVPIDGAVVAPGQILVRGKPQPVQSLEAGIVTHVAVKNGDRVSAGALILSLDPSLPKARLDIAREQLAAAIAEEARLIAEAEGRAQPDFTPPPLPFPALDMGLATTRQQKLFNTRQSQRAGARLRLSETDEQLSAQIAGLDAQITAGQEQQRLLRDDLNRQSGLVDKGLSPQAKLADLQRQDAELTGRIANLKSEQRRLEGARREAVLTVAQEDGARDEEVAQGLRDTTAKIQTLKAEVITLMDALARTDLRAPAAGIVHELAVPSPGAVISPATTLAQIIPTDRGMEIEVNVDPRNIDRVHLGQAAEIVVAAFDPRALPRLPATVTNVPPGATTDPTTGRSFYRVSLQLSPGSLPPDAELVPGMPVQAFLATGERPLLSWLVAPLLDPMTRALREE